MNNGVAELQQTFRGRGLTFRHFENAHFQMLRWQAGRIEQERATIFPTAATGDQRVELDVEVFRLVAFAATPEELAKRVSETTPSYRELNRPLKGIEIASGIPPERGGC